MRERRSLRAAFAEAASVAVDDVSVNLVLVVMGSDVTGKAVRALLVFLVLVAVFISIRFEWRMAVGAIVAMLHDVVISVGIYSVFGFVVTPATVIAFLTILGYSSTTRSSSSIASVRTRPVSPRTGRPSPMS